MFGLPFYTSLVFFLVPVGITMLLILWGQSYRKEEIAKAKRTVLVEQESVR
jgi:hypothetical protein